MKTKNRELKIIFMVTGALFALFLVYPTVRLLLKSILSENGMTMEFYHSVLTQKGFLKALENSFLIAGVSALLTTGLAFFLAYTIHYTNINAKFKKGSEKAAVLPMFLPTLTYGFAIIYSFGKQGFLTKLFGRQLFDIYGFNGLLIGYIIYTLPVSFLLIHNTMGYIDKKFMIVSRIMGDNRVSTFMMTIFRPLAGTLMASFIQSFFLCFTDFGIPASVGGKFEVIASVLYSQMLGSVPDFHKGSVVAVMMLLPSIVSIALLRYLEKYNVRYQKISVMELPKNRGRDWLCGIGSGLIILGVLSIFAVIFIVPFVQDWPYQTGFSMEHFRAVFQDAGLMGVYKNSLYVALLTAVFGTLAAYGSALITAQEGTLIVNTEQMEAENLDMPKSIKDLANPEYKGKIAVTDITSSSTAWLLIQGLISEYGEEEAKEILTDIYANAGDHLEESGSGPLKLVRAGEVAIGFGLRQQAVADKEKGLPVDYIDPEEGNFTLTESVAVVNKSEEKNAKAMEMAECIIKNGREELLKSYPIPLYEGESVPETEKSGNPKTFPEKLTVDLLKKHQELSESCKK
ncbi:extracellular solute-binding protein [Mediterraneibacter gnavus]|jgi:ABC-type sulfate transport system permease component|uniref:Extracellular solute-binding protein n=1 Tax=Mediterraneibacter gnavus TaxID=33038 RepID=A0AAJ3F9C1_MEDGN|nr:extracellular solute-binding protein [Mediterraneibacter gnavus]MCZ0631474.1 extracellular solute-binding protein [Mediterraneibacter gnavus]MDU4755880.1 extracellular solute-binding protein [Lachnospiraceae bacterium]NSI20445.1 extracellular solute-binding protein [Mediterraneibacter gnavus]